MLTRRYMTAKYVMLPAETSLPDALRFLNTKGVSLVGVLRHGRIAGAATRAQIYDVLESGDPLTLLSRKTLAEVLPVNDVSVSADDPLDRAARIMGDTGAAALAVVWKEAMVGVITQSDVCRAFCEIMGSRSPDAPMTMTLTTSGGMDLLDEIRRRSSGHSIYSLLAYPTPAHEWEVMLRLGNSPAD